LAILAAPEWLRGNASQRAFVGRKNTTSIFEFLDAVPPPHVVLFVSIVAIVLVNISNL